MISSIDTKSILPCTSCGVKGVRKLNNAPEDSDIFLPIKKIEEEKQLAASSFSFGKQLTPEEEQRVLFLKNMLSEILALAGGEPTEEQKARIKEVEKELEKITGIKTPSRISKVTAKMPGKDDEDKEEEQKQKQMHGIDPKEAIHKNIQEVSLENGPTGSEVI